MWFKCLKRPMNRVLQASSKNNYISNTIALLKLPESSSSTHSLLSQADTNRENWNSTIYWALYITPSGNLRYFIHEKLF